MVFPTAMRLINRASATSSNQALLKQASNSVHAHSGPILKSAAIFQRTNQDSYELFKQKNLHSFEQYKSSVKDLIEEYNLTDDKCRSLYEEHCRAMYKSHQNNKKNASSISRMI